MKFFQRLCGGSRRVLTNTQLSSGYSFLFGPTSSGRAVNERTAIQMTAVYSCVRILAEPIAGLAYVEQFLAGLSVSPKQEVDAGLRQLGAILGACNLGARDEVDLTDPVVQ